MNKFTASEQNKLQKDIERIARDSKFEYPVSIITQKGVDSTTLLKLNEIGTAEDIEYGKPEGKFHLKFKMSTYEFVNRMGETKRVKFPNLEGMTTADFYQMASDIIKFTEALRKFVNAETMANKEVIAAIGSGVGVELADKLLGLPGISTTMENTLRAIWSRSGSTQSFNAYLSDHSADRAVVELKDKFISASAEQYAEACKGIANALKKNGSVTILPAPDTTGVSPVIVAPATTSVSEITNIREVKRSLKTIL